MLIADRYLSVEGKQENLAEWNQAKSLATPENKRELGGHGYPDPDMIPWCDQLNTIPGVCTLQSCAGHGSAQEGYVASPGHLWILLDRELTKRFRARAFELAVRQEIERVSTLYSSWGQEIALIVFAGNERDSLDKSMRTILRFLYSLRTRPVNPQA